RVNTEGGPAPPLEVRAEGSDRSLPPGPSYVVGRDPESDIVITDARVSWQHAVLRLEDGTWVLVDNGSTNGTYAADQRVDRVEINGECRVRLGHPADGPVLTCTVSGGAPEAGRPPTRVDISALGRDRPRGGPRAAPGPAPRPPPRPPPAGRGAPPPAPRPDPAGPRADPAFPRADPAFRRADPAFPRAEHGPAAAERGAAHRPGAG